LHDIQEEFGDPSQPEASAWMARYSPYQNVKDGVAHPATLVCCGANDVRCPPWHSRLMVARLREADAGEQPILLRVWESTGHLPSASVSEVLDQTAEWLSFLVHHVTSPDLP